MKPCGGSSQMLPGTIGVAAFQINVAGAGPIAFWVDPHIVASFNYAVRLMELPQGMFGISLATYLLPTLAGLAAEKNYPEFRSDTAAGIGHLLFANLIAADPAGRAGRADRAADVRARQIRRRLDQPRGAGAGVPGAGAGRVFDGQHPGAGVLRAGRHQDADEDQHRLPGAESAAGRRRWSCRCKQGGLGIANTLTSIVQRRRC